MIQFWNSLDAVQRSWQIGWISGSTFSSIVWGLYYYGLRREMRRISR